MLPKRESASAGVFVSRVGGIPFKVSRDDVKQGVDMAFTVEKRKRYRRNRVSLSMPNLF